MPTATQWLLFQKMGDYNQDGYITQAEADDVATRWGDTSTSCWHSPPHVWNPIYDFNDDGEIDLRDIGGVANLIGTNIWDTFDTFQEDYKGWRIYYFLDGVIPSYCAHKNVQKSPIFTNIENVRNWINMLVPSVVSNTGYYYIIAGVLVVVGLGYYFLKKR